MRRIDMGVSIGSTITNEERAEIIELVAILQQTILEVSHAQQCGASWYTKGEKGLYNQVYNWVGKGQSAINRIKDILQDSEANGTPITK